MGYNNRIDQLEEDVEDGTDKELMMAHISPQEVIAFNYLQGGQKEVDVGGGKTLRDYSGLNEAFEDPEILNLFVSVVKLVHSGEEIPEDIKGELHKATEAEHGEIEPIESDYDPEIQKVAETGEGEDKVLVMIPKNICILFDSLRGAEKKDPVFGVNEYYVVLAAAALMAASYALGNSAEKDHEKEVKKRHNERRDDVIEARKQEMGYFDKPFTMNVNGTYGVTNSIKDLPARPKPPGYKTGGKVTGIAITGKGTGQSDEIKHDAKENDWIWDATTVAHFGDGSSNAGQKAINKFEKFLLKEELPKVKDVIKQSLKEKPLRKVPCALSDQERRTHAPIVAAAGKGSFQKGGVVLRKMTKELRKHKASNGLGLPPAAHDPTVYYKKAIKGV